MTCTPRFVRFFLAAILLSACSTPLPTYPPTTDQVALRTIADRLASVHSVSATAEVVLTSQDGRTVNLDGAFVARMPSHARLRAWKLGVPVFDLTVLPHEVWVFAQDQGGPGDNRLDVASLPAASVSPALELLAPRFYKDAIPQPDASTDRVLVVTGPALGRTDVRCEIDRATLTPRRFTLPTQAHTSELTLDRFAIVAGIVWPRRLTFRGPAGEIVVRLGDIELNTGLPDRAFSPPARARKLP